MSYITGNPKSTRIIRGIFQNGFPSFLDLPNLIQINTSHKGRHYIIIFGYSSCWSA